MSTTRTKNIIILIVAIAALAALCIYNPFFRNSFSFILIHAVDYFKVFHLSDTIKHAGLYILILVLVALLGFTITIKTRKKVWAIAGCIIDIAGLVTLFIVNQ